MPISHWLSPGDCFEIMETKNVLYGLLDEPELMHTLLETVTEYIFDIIET